MCGRLLEPRPQFFLLGFGSSLHVSPPRAAHSLAHRCLHAVSFTVRKHQPDGGRSHASETQKQQPSPCLHQLLRSSLSEQLTTKGLPWTLGPGAGIISKHFGRLTALVSRRVSSLLSCFCDSLHTNYNLETTPPPLFFSKTMSKIFLFSFSSK